MRAPDIARGAAIVRRLTAPREIARHCPAILAIGDRPIEADIRKWVLPFALIALRPLHR